MPENTPPGVNIGNPVSATDGDEDGEDNDDIEFGDTLTYSLSGTDAASFDIDAATGQLITKAPLDFENPSSGTGNNNNNYDVTVTVKDSSGTSVTQEVTISVTDADEEPGALAAPTVVATDSDNNAATFELKVIWYAPDDTGDGVTGYDVQYKKSTAVSFTDHSHTDTTTSTEIESLDDDMSYQVRVRARNGVGNGPWSLSSAGSTNKKDNDLPTFAESDPVSRTVLENAEAALVVGFPVSATDTDNVLPLTYRLHGPDADSFDLHSTSGQMRTKRGVTYDSETKPELSVTVTVSDGQGGGDARAVTISVTNVPEAPAAPARPTVRATPKSSRKLDVTWREPENMGPSITGYDVRYRKGGDDGFEIISPTGTGTTYTIEPTGDDVLEPGTSYEVYLRAKNGEIPSQWSAAGTGRTSIGNSEPVFDDRPNLNRDDGGNLVDATTERTVAENTRPGQSVGRAVRAVDGNGDGRTYRLVAETPLNTASEAARAKFDINKATGQILTKEPLNHEAVCSNNDASQTGGHQENCTYTAVVQVWDGRDGDRNEQDTSTITDDIIDDEITVTITVSDVAEKPAAPTVTVTSPVDGTTLTVTWDEPTNAGPPITNYRLECTGDEVPDDQCPRDIVTSAVINRVGTHTITGLTAAESYRVRVRADNEEGDGTWSSWVTQSTNKEDNTLPAFTSGSPTTLYVQEDAPSARQPVTTDEAGNQVVALQEDTAAGDGDSTTFRLEGAGAGRFEINRDGQIRTKSKLNHEDPDCGYDNEAGTTSCSYTVRAKLSDPNGGSIFSALTINVTDKDEPPDAPAAPRLTATSGSGWSLEVTWNEPRNAGPPITGYEIRYRKDGGTGTDAAWRQWTHTGTKRSNKITTIGDPDGSNQVHLEPSIRYEVQVRALNGEGDSTFADATNWSSSGKGSTGASNRRPAFEDTEPVVMLEVEENTRSGQNIGSAIEATDPDSNRLTYTLEGPGKGSFTITSTGQVRTRSPLNYEERSRYSVTVKVNDGQRKDNSVAAQSVSITVLDRPESPAAPRAPTVAGVPGSTDSVRVTWDEPTNPGPPITHYSVQYAVSGSRDAFLRVMVPTGSADRSVIITGLTAGTRYNVQVRAETEEIHSDWSSSGTGSPNPDVANRNPAFSGGSLTFSIAENTPPSIDVGSLVAALDPDGDVLTYILEGIDADSFDIIATNGAGQIQTKAALNHEEKSSYSVAVRVRDGRGGTDAVSVTIRVTDEVEAPDTPFAPTVTTASSASLSVSWEAPYNQGPPITDYDYRYRAVTDSAWTEVTNTTIRETTATIPGLTASTSYDVEVLAKNAEGASDWSNPGNGSTAAAGANSPPVFTDGTSATRSVSASSPTGTPIGGPVAATDADSDDTLTYSLEGRDAASFAINETNGQLLTKSGVTLIAGETYTVTVAANDGTDTSLIEVSIEATAAPPNNVPVFSEGASATRTVARSAAAGTAIGQPVRATDADSGDTLTYSLEGTDASSFNIDASTGQLLTRSGASLIVGSTYTVTVVASDGKDQARITVTITAANTAPVFGEGTSTTRSVRGGTPSGTNIGGPVSATDADTGDTLTYSLEGTDASSFSIAATNGQIRTQAALDASTKSRYSVTVRATDRSGGSATIAVTIDVTPRTLGCATRGAVADASNTGLVADCEALLKARDQLQDGGARLNWFEGTPIDRWQGITLGGTRMRVTEVDLNRMGLSGTIPAELGDVRRLTKLNLRSNSLTGVVPASLGNLRYLEVLNLHSNMLNGEIPDLSRTVLQELYLTNNVRWNRDEDGERISRVQGTGLSGGVPAWLNTMTDLRELWLWGNNLEGTMPDLSRMRSLDKLKLSGNTGLTGFSGAKLPSGLRWLVASETDVGAAAPDLSGMTSMTTLWLNKTGLSGAIPVASIPTSVSNLNLKDNSLRTIPDMSDLDNLRYLYLHRNDLGGEIPGTLGDMASIERIWLHENELTGIADGFRNASDTLTHLYLNGNSFDPGTCLPGDLKTSVANNDFDAAGLAACQ